MKLEQLNHFPSEFIREYMEFNGALRQFFDYTFSERDEQARFNELENYTYQRQALCDVLMQYQQLNHQTDSAAMKNIDRLREDKATVVVGGQQAGVFGGPLYTIHKMLSILIEANRLEKNYNRPVIPVFWIAGEDHDEDEIHATCVFDKRQRKCKLNKSSPLKLPASEQKVTKQDIYNLMIKLLQVNGESFRTNELINQLDNLIEETETYTSFFKKWMQNFFYGTGLVFMDAHDPEIRTLETEYFIDMIKSNREMRKAFNQSVSSLKQAGYGEPIETVEQNAHLFLQDINGERQLLTSIGEDQYTEAASGRHWNEHELIEDLRQGKITLSNNVVTRPVMQDLLLPVHTFIGGAGEIRYWGTLREVFSVFGHRMPLVKPRLHLTIVDRKSEKELNRYGLKLEDVISQGVAAKIDELSKRIAKVDDEEVLSAFEKKIQSAFNHLHEQYDIEPPHFKQANYQLENQLNKITDDHMKRIRQLRDSDQRHHINRLAGIEGRLAPGGQLQERVYSFVPVLHSYDMNFIDLLYQLLRKSSENIKGGDHIAIYL